MFDFDLLSLQDRGWCPIRAGHWGNDPMIEGDLYLCPLADWKNVPAGTVLTCITGERKTKGKDYIDLDTRGGMLAYGVVIMDWSVDLGKILDHALQPG